MNNQGSLEPGATFINPPLEQQIGMAPIRQPNANRFALLDSSLGSQHTATGMTQDVYESGNRPRGPEVESHARNSVAPPRQNSTFNYKLPLLLQIGTFAGQRRRRNMGTSLNIPEEIIRKPAFQYASLPAELRQMILRELVPTKSVWNGTSFPKSSPRRYQRDYFQTTKYLQNRALAH